MSNKITNKKLTHAYLYAAGHAVICYEKYDKDCGQVEWCEIHQKWTDAHLEFEGRLIFGRGQSAEMMRMAKRAKRIRATEASTSAGSDNTKAAGLAIADLTFTFGDYSDYVNFTAIPRMLSGPWTYQPETSEEVPSQYCSQWGSMRVAKVHVDAKVNAAVEERNNAKVAQQQAA